jgi:hypothetical protein
MDDPSFAGLLRSPAFGLSDAALFLLRQSGKPFWQELQEETSFLRGQDLARSQRWHSHGGSCSCGPLLQSHYPFPACKCSDHADLHRNL